MTTDEMSRLQPGDLVYQVVDLFTTPRLVCRQFWGPPCTRRQFCVSELGGHYLTVEYEFGWETSATKACRAAWRRMDRQRDRLEQACGVTRDD